MEKKTLQQFKLKWLLLAQIATWLIGLLSPFIYSPPRLSAEVSGGSWDLTAQFVLTAVVGLLWIIIYVAKISWKVLLAAFLISFVSGLFALAEYRRDYFTQTCEYALRGRLVIGETIYPDAKAYQQANRLTCSGLIEDSHGKTETIWPREEIIERFESLGWLYTLVTNLLASAVFFLLETLRKARQS